jgi:hypothetical protein
LTRVLIVSDVIFHRLKALFGHTGRSQVYKSPSAAIWMVIPGLRSFQKFSKSMTTIRNLEALRNLVTELEAVAARQAA